MRPATAIIPWRLRDDVEIHPADEFDSAWTVKDPVQLKYFQVGLEDLEFLQQLDGRTSLSETAQHLRDSHPGVQFSEGNLQHFLVNAINADLLVPVGLGFGVQLAARKKQRVSSAIYRKLLSFISHRFRGIDPSGLLKVLDRCFGWVFDTRVLLLASCFVIIVMALVLSRFDQIVSELPSFQQLFSPQNMLLVGVSVVIIKVLHEVGHGLTCRHYGGECHELGCIVIGILPLLYCDVSDSWLQRNRIYRVHVAAAGIAVELFLAAVFGMLWLASIPGTLHSFFLNVMLLCSLNTVLVNGNPLLRYDGYYVMSDLLRIPNLGAQSRFAALAVFDRVVLGLHQSERLYGYRRLWLPVFGAASMVYRLIITGTILFVLHNSLKQYRLEGITLVLLLSTVAGLVLAVRIFVRQRMSAVFHERGNASRAMVGLALLTMCLGCILFWPFAYSIKAPFTLTPGVSSPVFVSTPGHVTCHVDCQSQVTAGQVVATLKNPDIELMMAQSVGELKQRQARLVYLTDSRSTTAASAAALPAARDAIGNSTRRLETIQDKFDRLTLRAPMAGTIYPARSNSTEPKAGLTPAFWTGSILSSVNQSTWVNEQTLICWIGTPEMLRATLYVPQEEIEFIEGDSAAELSFRSIPGKQVAGWVSTIGIAAEVTAPAELVIAGHLPTDASTGELTGVHYGVQVAVNWQHAHPPLYSTGFATVKCRPVSLATRIWRALAHTFSFEM